ncbi:MAG: hypothetical protein KIT84_02880 [Labilithrix sp.]|nr:hypothetical protein [Labilithrix sp.]MCW5809926.1 hypothetical protein [Labilithrix sp.]
MTELQVLLDRHVAALTQAILESIKELSIDDFAALSEDAPPAPKPTTATITSAALDDVLALLSSHQSGLRSEQIRAALGIEKRALQRLIADGLEGGAIVKSGQRRATLYFARTPTRPAAEPAAPALSETETSILEHLNEAGPKGSNLKAWIISTHGELEAEEHARFEREGLAAFEALETRGTITSRFGGPARGTVYALAPAS